MFFSDICLLCTALLAAAAACGGRKPSWRTQRNPVDPRHVFRAYRDNCQPASDVQTPELLRHKYRYQYLIGEGANGKTWLGKELATGRPVAIKELKFAQMESFKSFELFQREAEVLASVHTAGVPRFYESILERDHGGGCYLVQEFIDAPSIQFYLNSGRTFTEHETLVILIRIVEILRVLQTVYRPAIIHRDIKPSNILCDIYDGISLQTIHPWLIDFGAVANPQKRSGGSTIAGTTGYMAPEQLMGECAIQSDFYALGATALHMITGVPPWQMEVVGFELQYAEILKQKNIEISKQFQRLLELLLSPKLELRPESAAILHNMLANVLVGTMPEIHFNPNPWQSLKLLFMGESRLEDYATEEAPPVVAEVSAEKLLPRGVRPNITHRWTGKATGILRVWTTKPGKKDLFAEYTFDIGDTTYGGCTPMEQIQRENGLTLSQQECASQYGEGTLCRVCYNPKNPFQNVLERFV